MSVLFLFVGTGQCTQKVDVHRRMYSLNWNAGEASCLVIGGGHVAVRKVKGLLAEGAHVTVIAPLAEAAIHSLAREGRLVYEARPFAEGDEGGYSFVVSTSGVPQIAHYLSAAWKRRFFLYNAADFPSLGNCTLPARLKRGSLTVAISTEGKSPAFSKYIKYWLDGKIPENYGDWLDRLAKLRLEAKLTVSTSQERETFWRAAFGEDVLRAVSDGELDQAEEIIRHAMGRFGAES